MSEPKTPEEIQAKFEQQKLVLAKLLQHQIEDLRRAFVEDIETFYQRKEAELAKLEAKAKMAKLEGKQK